MKSFSLLESLLSIIIVATLSSFFILKKEDNNLSLARNQLINDISLAILRASIDDRFKPYNKNFYASYWQINFNKKISKQNVVAYSMFATNYKNTEINKRDKSIKNPINYKKIASGGYYTKHKNLSSKEVYLNDKYKIDSLKISSNCRYKSSAKLLFNDLGSIFTNIQGKKAEGICSIDLFKDGNKATICIDSKTSYIYAC